MYFNSNIFTTVLIIFCGWIFSVCLHEWAHSVIAYMGGDKSVKQKGYLSFNPLAYIHPTTTILLPIVVLAVGGVPLTGGAVYIDHTSIPSRLMRSLVSLAGPSANIISAILFVIIYRYIPIIIPSSSVSTVLNALGFLIFLQFYAAIINLLPIPPLDGYGIIEPWFTSPQQKYLRTFGAKYGLAVLLVLLFLVPNFSKTIINISLQGSTLLGIPSRAIGFGTEIFLGNTSKATFGILTLIMLVGFYFHHYIFNVHLRYFQNGYKFFMNGQYNKALTAYKISIEKKPQFYEGWKQLGLTFYMLGKYKQSITAIQKAVTLNSTDWTLYLINGNNYAYLKKFTQSKRDFSTALKFSPNNPAVYNDRGLASTEEGNYQEAISDFGKAIKLGANITSVKALSFNNWGYVLYLQEDFDAALSNINKSLTIDPNNFSAYYNRALVYLAKRLNTAAKDDLFHCIELCKTDKYRQVFQAQELIQKANLQLQKII